VAAPKLPLVGRQELLSLLDACTWGYPVLRVPTVALGPTPGEAANLHSLSESLYVGIPKRWCSTADTW
jgi:hypothetical protein